MKSLVIIGFAFGAVLAGCASTSGSRGEPTASAAGAPAQQRARGDRAGMMAETCPMQVPGTTVTATELEGGIDLAFTTTTTTADVSELRRRVRRMAEMYNQPGGQTLAGGGTMGGGMMRGGTMGDGMRGGGMGMPAATASVEDIGGGARLILQPKDPAQLGSLREHTRMKAERMASGECPMMSRGNGPSASSSPPAAGAR